jgi:polar amino acid transport system substrate-binding protein
VIRQFVLALFLAFGAFVTGEGSAAEKPVLRIAAPEAQSAFSDLIAAVVRDAGIEPQIEIYPAARSRQQFVDGEVDAEFFRVPTAVKSSYPAETIMIGPLIKVTVRLYGLAEKRLGNDNEQLLGRRLGHNRGHLLIERLVRQNTWSVDVANNRDSLYKMLLGKRFDLALDEERLALRYLKTERLEKQVKTFGQPVAEEYDYFLLHPQKRELESRLRDAFDRWVRDGRWDKGFRAINRAAGLPEDTSAISTPDIKTH